MNAIIGLAVAVVSVGFLIDGFRTGVMHCFVSLALNGEAPRRGNPTWFWAYAGFNIFNVVVGVLLLASTLAHN